MNTPDDPLLRAILQDEAWQTAFQKTRLQAASTLRRRRCWLAVRQPLALAALLFCSWEAIRWAPQHQNPALVQQPTSLPTRLDLHAELTGQFALYSSLYLPPSPPITPDLSLPTFKPQYETSLLYESPLLSESPILLYKPFYE